MESAILQSFIKEEKTISLPQKTFDTIRGSATEKKQSSFIKWIKIKVILNQARQSIDSHAKIRITRTNEYSRYAVDRQNIYS